MVTKVWMPGFPTFRAKSTFFGWLERLDLPAPEGSSLGPILLETAACETRIGIGLLAQRVQSAPQACRPADPLEPHIQMN
jgi:hypothetical protein